MEEFQNHISTERGVLYILVMSVGSILKNSILTLLFHCKQPLVSLGLFESLDPTLPITSTPLRIVPNSILFQEI